MQRLPRRWRHPRARPRVAQPSGHHNATAGLHPSHAGPRMSHPHRSRGRPHHTQRSRPPTKYRHLRHRGPSGRSPQGHSLTRSRIDPRGPRRHLFPRTPSTPPCRCPSAWGGRRPAHCRPEGLLGAQRDMGPLVPTRRAPHSSRTRRARHGPCHTCHRFRTLALCHSPGPPPRRTMLPRIHLHHQDTPCCMSSQAHSSHHQRHMARQMCLRMRPRPQNATYSGHRRRSHPL